MRKMKKVLSLVLSLVLVCGIVAGFAACSGNKENNKKEDTTAQSDLAKIQAAGVLKVASGPALTPSLPRRWARSWA